MDTWTEEQVFEVFVHIRFLIVLWVVMLFYIYTINIHQTLTNTLHLSSFRLLAENKYLMNIDLITSWFKCRLMEHKLLQWNVMLRSFVLVGKMRFTWLGYFVYVHALLLGHEAQHWENGKSCQETGAAVQEAKKERVPARSHRKRKFLNITKTENLEKNKLI